ncbi:MAG: hypothetical protein H0Z32_02900 [Bacillaceae bacterium]|nr:hypothetical protein [Bacillaceae bacterium]
MRSLQDAVYNWLTIQLVADKRPEDRSARETAKLFREILSEDHQVTDIQIEVKEDRYFVTCEVMDHKARTFQFPKELIETIYNQIMKEPEKYPTFEETESSEEDHE